MARAREYDPEAVVESAMQAFWAHGFTATSVRDLVAATGINRASLYAAFTDKRGLFLQCLQRYDDRHRRAFLDRLATEYPPREAILAAFASAARACDDSQPEGCLLVNTALEVAPHDPRVQRVVATALAGVEAFFYECVLKAQQQGAIRADLDTRTSAQTLLSLFLGLRVLKGSGAAPDGAPAAIEARARMLLD